MNEAPEKLGLLYEGKAKKVWETSDPDLLIVEFKDDATAFNARKRGTIEGKGAINNEISWRIFEYLETRGVPTHFVSHLSRIEQLVRRVTIIPVETIVRNRAAGSFAERYGVAEGLNLDPTVIEWCYKSDELGDPPMNDAAVVALGLADEDSLAVMFELAVEVNESLRDFFEPRDLDLIDFKIEFGKLPDGSIVLADEISPDTCRLWDAKTGEKQDKDRFRRDLGGVEDAYREVLRRVRLEVEPRTPHHHDETIHDEEGFDDEKGFGHA